MDPTTYLSHYKRAHSGRDLVHLVSISWHPIEPMKSRVGPGLPRPGGLWTPKLDDTGIVFTTEAPLRSTALIYPEATCLAVGSHGGQS